MTNNRKKDNPVILMSMRKKDWVLEVLGVFLLILYWVVLSLKYPTLADNIPSHFDSKGNPDAYAAKSFVWELPRIATILYLLMTVLAFFPRYFNYGVVDITAENAKKEYGAASTSIRYMKGIVLITFMLISGFLVF